MIYSIDLRNRVVDFVTEGGSKVEAARRFQVSTRTVFNWISRENLAPTKHSFRQGKINKSELIQYVKDNSDTTLRECAEVFGVHTSALSRMLKKLGIRKKNDAVRGKNVYQKD